MILCDIGNTSYHFLDGNNEYKKDVKTFNPNSIKEKVYFISVHKEIQKNLNNLKNWIDLSLYIDKSNYYKTMGIDRIVAVKSVFNGIIVDAGSAITVDIVKNGEFIGGFIYPGVRAMQNSYATISPALSYVFNFECDLDRLPKNSQDAISYGFLKTLYCEVISHDMPIVLTGGDAQLFKKVFKNAKVDDRLLFSGMKKVIEKSNIK